MTPRFLPSSPNPFTRLFLPRSNHAAATTTTTWSESEPPPPPQPSSPSPPQSAKNQVVLSFFNFGNSLSRSLRSISIPTIRPRLPSPPPSSEAAVTTTALQRKQQPTWVDSGCPLPLFRPYVAKVPWHGGVRAFLSQLFPRYGHYCGPNWSSGKDGGLPLWDRRPIDWLDFCCYCHDIGYDTHDQAKLLKADLAFLECLERPRMATKGDAHVAHLYKSMCIAGLRNILIPYRMQLVKMQAGTSFVEVMNSLIGKGGACRRS